NPLPDSFIVVMHDLSKYDETVAKIQKIPGVDPDTILNRKDFADKLTRISSLVNLISVAVVSALLVISLFIIANTIRATMYSRRFEISIMKSVGATNSFVRMPFLVEGMVIGLISAIIATGVLVLVYQGVGMVVENAQSMFDFIPILQVLPYAAAAFILFGIFVGFCGGFLSIRKYLKMEGNEILGW
ncbi:MAG: permease-like cell division protein FtsX, partial [Ruminococcus sp.]|nr:permease-like cell division protein FtsX [Ruminococcus sp.]